MLFCFKLGNASTIGSKVVEIIFNNIYTQKQNKNHKKLTTLILYIFRESWRRNMEEYYTFERVCF